MEEKLRKLVIDYINTQPQGLRDIAKDMNIGIATMCRIIKGGRMGRILMIKLRKFFEGLQ